MWKDVVGFEGAYEVSDNGVVRSLDRKRTVADSMGRVYEVTNKGRVLATRVHQFGYSVVTLSLKSVAYTRTVHRLMARAFLGISETQVVRHLDGNPRNNSLKNLTCGTQADNVKDAMRHGTVQCGESRYNAKLTALTVVEIREKKAAGGRNNDLATEYGLSEVCIHKLVTGKVWTSVGGPISSGRLSNILSLEDRVSVEKMRSDGMALAKIAAIKNVSVTQVVNILKEAA